MLPEGKIEIPGIRPPFSHLPRRKKESLFAKVVIYGTWAVIFLFMLLSILISYNPVWTSEMSTPFNPYFFILLLPIILPFSTSIIALTVVMFSLYIIFFLYQLKVSSSSRKRKVLDTPMGYFAALSTASFCLVVGINLLFSYLGISIGGTGIDTGLQQHPFLYYISLIYAPFVEELGFRIIPLGLLTFALIYRRSRNLKDSLYSIALPGKFRGKYSIKLTSIDLVLVAITSILFAYAHVYFGLWYWAKLPTTLIVGVVFAIGYLKFGPFVDIPMHWFFNGLVTLVYIEPALSVSIGMIIFWFIFAGIVSMIFIGIYLRNYYRKGEEIVIGPLT